jgi:hypothetical protein
VEADAGTTLAATSSARAFTTMAPIMRIDVLLSKRPG